LNGEAAAGASPSADESSPSTPFDDLLRRFFENRGNPNPGSNPGREVVALGSGFIIDPSGYVVTNNHVVGNSEKITVMFQDNSRHQAKIVGRDEKTDIALLKIDGNDRLPFVTWGDSNESKVGDWVVAVGNPFSLGGTVTAGIISALGRNINEGPYDDFIQLDAPINRGNSGSPAAKAGLKPGDVILTANGQPVKSVHDLPRLVASMPPGQKLELSVRRGGKDMNLAATTAEMPQEQQTASAQSTGEEKGPPPSATGLGLQLAAIDQSLRREFRIPKDVEGAVVTKVASDSPAAALGIEPGDVIVSVDQQPVKSPQQAAEKLKEASANGNILLLLNRHGTSQFVGLPVSPSTG